MHFGRWTDVDGQNIIAQRWPSTADMDLWWHARNDRCKDGSCINALLWQFLSNNDDLIQLLEPLWVAENCDEKQENNKNKNHYQVHTSYFPFPQTPVAPFAAPPSSARRWLLLWRGWDARGQSEPKCWDPNGTHGACTSARSSILVKHDWYKNRKDLIIECYFQYENISYHTTLSDMIWHGHVLPDLNTNWNETEPFDHSHAKVTWTQFFLVKAPLAGWLGNFILSTESFSSKYVALCISFCQGTSLQCVLGACHCMESRRPQSRVFPLFMLML